MNILIKNTFLLILFLSTLTKPYASSFEEGTCHSDKFYPFAYHSLPEDRDTIRRLFEGHYVVLKDDSPLTACLGSLSPNILIALRNDKLGVTVVFHKYYNNSLKHLFAIAKKNLKIEDPYHIRGQLFTVITAPERNIGENWPKGIPAYHEGRSEKEELRHLKNKIVEHFDISDRAQIKANLFMEPKADPAPGECPFDRASLQINSRLKMKSTCLFHENFFNVKEFEDTPHVGPRLVSYMKHTIAHQFHCDARKPYNTVQFRNVHSQFTGIKLPS